MSTIEPGIFPDVDEVAYHSDKRSLSVSGAKKLLPPSCPAIFKWQRDHGQPNKQAFDFGHAAHAEVLGVGAPIIVIDADNWMTKAAKAERDEAYARGEVPLLVHEHLQVQAMARALREDPVAGGLFTPGTGAAEQSMYWHDEEHDVWRRGRADWITETASGRLLIVDYKSTTSAEPSSCAKSVANFGYDMQSAWYRDGAIALGLHDDPAFLFVFQEKTAPYLVTVAELDEQAMRRGAARNRQALEVYTECMATDTWPGYSSDIALLTLPRWATYGMDYA